MRGDENKQLGFIVVVATFMFLLFRSVFFFIEKGFLVLSILLSILEFIFLVFIIYLTYKHLKKLKLKPKKLRTKMSKALHKFLHN